MTILKNPELKKRWLLLGLVLISLPTALWNASCAITISDWGYRCYPESTTLSNLGVSVDDILCVDYDSKNNSFFNGECTATYSYISEAISHRETDYSGRSVAIVLAEGETPTDSITLTSADSNTYFIGCEAEMGISDVAASIVTLSNPTNVTDHTFSIESGENIGFYYLTLGGIYDTSDPPSLSAADSTDYEEAATFSIGANVTGVTLSHLTFGATVDSHVYTNYYQALLIGSGSTVTADGITITNMTAPTVEDHDTTVGIWNEGNLSLSNIALDGSYDFGIVSAGAGNVLNLSSDSGITDGAGVAAVSLYDNDTANDTQSDDTISVMTFGASVPNTIDLYIEDSSLALSLSGAQTKVVGCQTDSSDVSAVSLFFDTDALDNLYFGYVTAYGTSNLSYDSSINITNDGSTLLGDFVDPTESTQTTDTVNCGIWQNI